MGRINDALRRDGSSRAEASVHGAAEAEADAFVSPWGIGDEDTRTVQREKAAQPAIERPHRGASPRLAVMPTSLLHTFNPEWRERLTAFTESDPTLTHQFRRLAATLLQAQRRAPLKSVMITSAAPHDGKTLTALNIALVLSGSYRLRVLLIEGDLRRPGISAAINLQTPDGLTDTLKASDDQKVPLVKLTDTLTLLPAGRPDPDPLSGLASPRMQRLLQDATEQFDWVILDTPPLGPTADAGLLCPLVDAAILVIRAGHTPYAAIQSAVETLGLERILGVVLNGVDEGTTTGYYSEYTAN